jgi:hypothetical protein
MRREFPLFFFLIPFFKFYFSKCLASIRFICVRDLKGVFLLAIDFLMVSVSYDFFFNWMVDVSGMRLNIAEGIMCTRV